MMRHVTWGCLFAAAIASSPTDLTATVSPQEVSKKLVMAFSSETGVRALKARVVEKKYVGLKTQTVIFALGKRTYRVVFSPDQSVVVSLQRQGEVGSQQIWTSPNGKAVTVEEIVNSIYSNEFGRSYEGLSNVKNRPSETPDLAARKIETKSAASDLRWNSLMNQIIKGETTSLLGSKDTSGDKGLQNALSMAKAMDPCSANRGKNTQRAALTDIAQAVLSLQLPKASNDEFLADHSREYEKKSSYSALKEMNAHKDNGQAEEAFKLIQQTRSDAYEIFQAALYQKDEGSKDPYSLAALRNYKTIAISLKEEDGKKLVDAVLAKTIVDVEEFTKLRRKTPKASVIYDRGADQFYVDPTLNSPSQARYLLSLAVLYAWNTAQPSVVELSKKYEDTQKRIERIEDAILDETDANELENQKKELTKLSKEMFQVADRLRQTMAPPK